MNQEAVTIWNLINTGGMVAVMFVILWLLLRGDILPRKVYEDLTTRILNELCTRVVEAVRELREEIAANREGDN
jgi:fumarate reductase subunit D